MRAVVAIIVGILAALVTQSAGDYLGNVLYPSGITDMWDRAQVTEALATRPPAALWVTVASYFLGGLVGGCLGKLVWRAKAAAWVPAILLSFMALVIAWGFPGAGWAMIANVAAPLIGGLIANHLVKDRVAAAPEEAGATTGL